MKLVIPFIMLILFYSCIFKEKIGNSFLNSLTLKENGIKKVLDNYSNHFSTKTEHNLVDDKSKYRHIIYDFYKNDKGDIFEKKEIKGVGFFFDSLMFYGEHPKRVPLRNYIDLASYIKFDSKYYDFYSKDKNHVYYTFNTMEYLHRSIIEKADIKSFKVLDKEGKKAIDKNYIYIKGEILK